jgi:hypothetical protein
MLTKWFIIVVYNSGLDELASKKELPFLSSGDAMLDGLLGGGFRRDTIYLLIGDRKLTTDVLIATAVGSFADVNFSKYVGFVDGNNRFNPYALGKLAVNRKLSPSQVLDRILIARAFTYDQMIEILEHRIVELENVELLLISGISSMWPNYEQHTFEELSRAIKGIKKVVEKSNPMIIITAPRNAYSDIKPVGGNSLYHFGHALVLMEQTEREVIYTLLQHPSLPEKQLKKFLPRKPKRGMKSSGKNETLDAWI